MINRSLSILMADDDSDDQYLVQRAIDELNSHHRLLTVNNGQQLVQQLKNAIQKNEKGLLPDCILLDLNMPLLDGFGVLQQVRKMVDLQHLPVFVLSTSRRDTDREKALQMGANAFYVKPACYNDLKSILTDIISTAQLLKSAVQPELWDQMNP